jgi:hypothetical protein
MRARKAEYQRARDQQTPAWADRKRMMQIYAEAAELTRLTGMPHEVDHTIPLQGRHLALH